jgi:hypothetical protein
MPTRADYRGLIQKEVDDTSTTNIPLINNIIREVYQEVASEIFVGDTYEEITVTGETITPTKTYQQIDGVHFKTDGDYYQLRRITEQDYQEHINDTPSTPLDYIVRGDTLFVPGASTGTLRIQGVEVMEELDDDTTVSIVPARFSRVIILGGIYRFLGYEKDPAAENYRGWYEKAKRDMLQQLGVKGEVITPTLYDL